MSHPYALGRRKILVQGTGINKWYGAGVGWVDSGRNYGTRQPNHTLRENRATMEPLLNHLPLPSSLQIQILSFLTIIYRQEK